MNTENAIWFAKKFSQLTDKQFETFCNRMQKSVKTIRTIQKYRRSSVHSKQYAI